MSQEPQALFFWAKTKGEKLKTIQKRFEAKFEKGGSGDCWEWTACKNRNGYGTFKLSGRRQSAHRVSYQLYVEEIPDGLHVLHRCDNPGCVRPEHLFIGTHTDNMRDCENKARRVHQSGEKNGGAKLTAAQVVEIRERFAAGELQIDLAKEFGVARETISRIVCGHTWEKHKERNRYEDLHGQDS
jgi:hypothetical protein